MVSRYAKWGANLSCESKPGPTRTVRKKSTSGEDCVGHASRLNGSLHIVRSQDVRTLEYEDSVRRKISIKPVGRRSILSLFREHAAEEGFS